MLSLSLSERNLRLLRNDGLAFAATIVMVHVIVFFELFVILPYIDRNGSQSFWLHVAIGSFIYVNIVGSMWLTMKTDASTRHLLLPSVLQHGWRFCSSCEANAPPRAKHCWVCGVCVLKRDHHCTVAATCIGFRNQRYFINLVSYLAAGTMYCNYLNMDYTLELLGGFSFYSLIAMMLPLLAWLFGLAPTYTFAVALIAAYCIIGFFVLSAYLVYHMQNIFRDQTMTERANGLRNYDCGWINNLKTVFGNRYLVAIFCPFVPSLLVGNGIDYQENCSAESVKQM